MFIVGPRNFKEFINYHTKIPFAIRAMLRVLILKSGIKPGQKTDPSKHSEERIYL
jgi:hypothetical protein